MSRIKSNGNGEMINSKSDPTSRSFSISTIVSTSSNMNNNNNPNNVMFRSATISSTLEDIKLSHILNGETCPPISFPDFASFVTHKEFTTENLLFVIWFRSFRCRFESLSEETKWGIPIPSTRLRDRYSPFAYLDNAIQDGKVSIGGSSSDSGAESSDTQVTPPRKNPARIGYTDVTQPHDWKPCEWTVEGRPCQCGDKDHNHKQEKSKWGGIFGKGAPSRVDGTTPTQPSILHPASIHPPLPPAGTVLVEPKNQAMREEAERAFATFLRKGGSRELGISDELRTYARDCLKRSSAPECFLPIYEEVYQVIESQSLPHFLDHAKTNINRPKQLFWYYVGFTDFLIGLIIFLIITFLVPQKNFGYRLTRLPSAIFTVFGAMQFYSASRGFCNQVWGRTSRQIRPWEMDTLDDEEELIENIHENTMINHHNHHNNNSNPGFTFEEKTKSPISTTLETPGSTAPYGMTNGVHEDKGNGNGNVEMDIQLGDEVHPLADLSGHGLSSSPSETWSPGSDIVKPIFEDTEDLTEAQRAQLAIRRNTVKLPSPELAFPIMDNGANALPLHFDSTPPQNSSSRIGRLDREISPFAEPETPLSPITPKFQTNNTDTTGAIEKGETKSDDLRKFRKAEPIDPKSFKEGQKDREKRTKVFGPEKLVEDPRVVKLMKAIVRDILIVGSITGVIWIALCLAVPMYR